MIHHTCLDAALIPRSICHKGRYDIAVIGLHDLHPQCRQSYFIMCSATIYHLTVSDNVCVKHGFLYLETFYSSCNVLELSK